MPATALKMVSGPTAAGLTVNGVYLPMRSYVFESDDQKLQVYQCRWEPGVTSAYAGESERYNLIRGVWAGRGNQGQKVLEVIVNGYDDPAQASQALIHQLEKLIQVKPQTMADGL
jgi:predicted small secreted protein